MSFASGLSNMFKIGRKKKKEETLTPADAIQKLRQSGKLLETQQAFVEKKVEEELKEAKKNGMANKKMAIMALQRKRRLLILLTKIDCTLTEMELEIEALESASTEKEVLRIMIHVRTTLKNAQLELDVKDDDIMSGLENQEEGAIEITPTTCIPILVGYSQYGDEDDLMEELDDLLKEELDEQLLSVGPSVAPQLPDVPTDKPVKDAEENEDIRELS